VELDRGAVKVDAALRSSVKGIWAVGDVAGGPQFTHVAECHGKLVLRNAIFPFTSKVDYSAVPAVTYTDPEVARVGLTEAGARERLGRVEVQRHGFADLDRAIVDGHDTGFVTIVTRPKGRILGATIIGSGAGDLLVSATPLGLRPDGRWPWDLTRLPAGVRVYDMAYRPSGRTSLESAAQRAGLRASSGHSMLLYQGVEAFLLWTGAAAPIEAMASALRAEILP